ncbi:MAG: adenylate/guanylate cyclase domain-containing protein [bacterium]
MTIDAEKPVILAVDDEEKNLKLLQALLEHNGYIILKARNGTEALGLVEKEKPDLVLLDVMMPFMDGYEVCRAIKNDTRFGYLPVIMITALDQMDAKLKGLDEGADDFLTKPYQKVELLTRIRNLLKIKNLYTEVELRNLLISNILHSYVDDNVIEKILSNPKAHLKLGGEKKEIAVLFCDVRGFTSVAEKLSAEEVIWLLNDIYKELTKIVFKYNGTFDKYMGDCIMALWGAPIPVEDETLKSIQAAIAMQCAFEKLKLTWSPELRNLGIGVGINYGEVVVGNIGTYDQMDYTAIGDVVNTAYRVQGMAESRQILITKNVVSKVKDRVIFKEKEKVKIKGKKQTVEIFEVVGFNESVLNTEDVCEIYISEVRSNGKNTCN